MISLVFMAIILAALIRLAPADPKGDYLSPAATRTVNGFFVICVFFRHLFQYRAFAGEVWGGLHWMDRHLGQFIVVGFLFFSGYGIMESWKKKGMSYIRQIPLNRLWKTWTRFAVCVLVYLGVALLKKEVVPLHRLPGIFLGWESVGNSNWYIFVILCLYLLTWLAFGLAAILAGEDERRIPGIALILHLLMAMALGYGLSLCQDRYWYNTILVYTGGMAFSCLRPSWDRFLGKHGMGHVGFLILEAGLLVLCYRYQEQIIAYELAALLFAFFLCWFMGRVQIRSRALAWLGENLFGIYMMQRVPMILLEKTQLTNLIYMLICGVLTLLLGWGMQGLGTFLNQRKWK